VKAAAHRSHCPRLSEASEVLALIRGYLAGAAPRPLATTIDLVPIVEGGLFGYELVPERDLRVYPIIGRNAQGEPALRVTSCGDRAKGLHLVSSDGGVHFQSGRASRFDIRTRDNSYPNWLAAAEAAWSYLHTSSADLRGQAPIRREMAHRFLDRALAVAHSHLDAWDPYIEFLGLPNEAQLGFVLTDTGGGRGMLMFQQPDMWTLRWNASDGAINTSWSRANSDVGIGARRTDGERRAADRRALSRRASDRGADRDDWPGQDRRRARGRRAIDRLVP
jgi:hypothetical protein